MDLGSLISATCFDFELPFILNSDAIFTFFIWTTASSCERYPQTQTLGSEYYYTGFQTLSLMRI